MLRSGFDTIGACLQQSILHKIENFKESVEVFVKKCRSSHCKFIYIQLLEIILGMLMKIILEPEGLFVFKGSRVHSQFRHT